MESEEKAISNPSAMLAALLSKRDKLQEELRSIEKQVKGGAAEGRVAAGLTWLEGRLPAGSGDQNERRPDVGGVTSCGLEAGENLKVGGYLKGVGQQVGGCLGGGRRLKIGGWTAGIIGKRWKITRDTHLPKESSPRGLHRVGTAKEITGMKEEALKSFSNEK
ncbi:hypothetical protein KSP39_PZI023553 [Platanthera zijinensis]|uniref:Uncharacterized protein n=1 Tax=Platanthera zijinensis TaxID=2320716 RepID=A0AAP0FU53_9ASPA